MILAIPVDENTKRANVYVSFDKAPYFMFYNTDDRNTYFAENKTANEPGAGIKAAQIIVNKKTDILLTPQCGASVAEVILAADIGLYKSQSGTALSNVEAYFSRNLSELKEIHDDSEK